MGTRRDARFNVVRVGTTKIERGAISTEGEGLNFIGNGTISIGNDSNAQAINIGTGAAARTITIGNATGASSVDLDVGTGSLLVGTTATAHQTTVGSTNTTCATTVQAGTGALAVNGGGAVTVDAVGVLELNSSGAAIGIGNDANAFAIGIGTGAAQRDIQIGNPTGTTSVAIAVGTGELLLGTTATAHQTTVGSTNTTCATTVQAGTGDLVISGGGIATIDAATTLELNVADAGAINIGNDVIQQTITVGNAHPATVINSVAGQFQVTGSSVQLQTAGTGIAFQEGLSITVYSGNPNGDLMAAKGSITLNPLGSGVADRMFINTDGAQSWTSVTTAT